MSVTEANGQTKGEVQGRDYRTGDGSGKSVGGGSGKGTGIFLDDAHRSQVQDWMKWYYDGTVKLATVVQEMMDLAYAVASADNQRVETAEQRRARLAGKS